MPPCLDIVIPLHNEQANIEQLVERLKSTLTAVDLRWRVIFVDDGSTDGSDVALRLLCADDPGFVLVTLSRKFGHMAAVQAGLDHSDADAVVLLDGDLQDPPEYIPALVAAWRAGAEVVYGERTSRRETGWRWMAIPAFHAVFRLLVREGWPSDVGTFSLLDRRAATALCSLREPAAFFPGLRHWVGFRQAAVPYERASRFRGAPKQSGLRLSRYAADALFGYTNAPLRVLGLIVFICLGSSLVFALAGSFVLAGVAFFSTLNTAGMWIVGIYAARAFEQGRARPRYVVRSLHGLPRPE